MAQPSPSSSSAPSSSAGGFKLCIQDANGQPQMVKIVHATNSGGQIQIPSSAIKSVFKMPSTAAEGSSVQRSVNITGIKGVPASKSQKTSLEAMTKMSIPKKVQNLSVAESSKLKIIPKVAQPVQKSNASPQVISIKTEPERQYVSKNAILGYSIRKRPEPENERLDYSSKRRRMVDKVGKGLRHFSMKVCEKVRKKGFTSYNEVADELVAEFTEGLNACQDNQQYDQKNIRRRVYDALNVLMAMNIISKEKKEIRWLGLPTNSIQECSTLEEERKMKMERIEQKTRQLHDLIAKHISFKNLVERNKEAESKGLVPSSASIVQLPFIAFTTHDKTHIDCSISNDKREYVFNFDHTFNILDDVHILKQMGLLNGLDESNCSEDVVQKAKTLVPKSLEGYVDEIARGGNTVFKDNIKCELEDTGEGSGIAEFLEEDDSNMFSDEAEGDHDEEDQESGSDADLN